MEFLKTIFSHLFGPFTSELRGCLLCGAPSRHELICMPCQKHLAPGSLARCSICGRYILEQVPNDYVCGECQDRRPPFFLARSVAPYQGLMVEALYALKYQRKRELAIYFGERMGEVFLNEKYFWDADVLIPVPLSRNKAVQRGFNQAQLLADAMGGFLKIRVLDALVRTQDTRRQSGLKRQARFSNMRGIFFVKEYVQAKKVILIDDIYTTGATAAACTNALLGAGAAKISVLTVASGIQQKNLNHSKEGK